MDLFLATNNKDKAKEFISILSVNLPYFKIFDADSIGGMPNVNESGSTFKSNALIKAKALSSLAPEKCFILADDSGLVVDALDGAPGVYSSRYAGNHASDCDNRAKLLDQLSSVPMGKRDARFICVLALIGPDFMPITFTGICEGSITLEEEGYGGFGYDLLFRPVSYQNTFGVIPHETKNTISHRAKALSELTKYLIKYHYDNLT